MRRPSENSNQKKGLFKGTFKKIKKSAQKAKNSVGDFIREKRGLPPRQMSLTEIFNRMESRPGVAQEESASKLLSFSYSTTQAVMQSPISESARSALSKSIPSMRLLRQYSLSTQTSLQRQNSLDVSLSSSLQRIESTTEPSRCRASSLTARR